MILKNIQVHKVSLQLKKGDEYALQCFRETFFLEKIINLCFREPVIRPLFLQQNP